MQPNIEEILRYLRVTGEAPEELRTQVERIANDIAKDMPQKYTYRAFRLTHAPEGEVLEGSGITLTGRLAAKMLRSCDTAVLLACTLGIKFDQRVKAQERRDMGEAVILDACGSSWVENGCNMAEEEIAARFAPRFLTDRFSPGYGDLPFSLQPMVLRALDAERRLGIHVSDSFLMTPMKSVTAVIGISDEPQPARVRGCAYCNLRKTCEYRKGGTTCADETAAF